MWTAITSLALWGLDKILALVGLRRGSVEEQLGVEEQKDADHTATIEGATDAGKIQEADAKLSNDALDLELGRRVRKQYPDA